jgi:hypothetical protein
MDAPTFSTRPFAVVDQGRVWTEWFQPTFDMQPEAGEQPGFAAEYSVWYVGDLFITWATGPATRVSRTPRHVRRSPIDHWVLSYCREGATTISTKGRDVAAMAGVPFLWSLGYALGGRSASVPRLQVYLPRDSFQDMRTMLDMAVANTLDAQRGQLLADYLLLSKRNLPHFSPGDAARLPAAIQAMLGVCLARLPTRWPPRLARSSSRSWKGCGRQFAGTSARPRSGPISFAARQVRRARSSIACSSMWAELRTISSDAGSQRALRFYRMFRTVRRSTKWPSFFASPTHRPSAGLFGKSLASAQGMCVRQLFPV